MSTKTPQTLKGIDLVLRVPGPENPDQLTSTQVVKFATFRKCKALSDLAKKIRKHELDQTEQALVVMHLDQAWDDMARDLEATPEKIREFRTKVEEESDKLETMEDQKYDNYYSFVMQGFTGAGYSKADAEKFMEYVEYDKFAHLIDRARFGAGRLDFSKVPSPI